jgi:hypothetical protein
MLKKIENELNLSLQNKFSKELLAKDLLFFLFCSESYKKNGIVSIVTISFIFVSKLL